MPHVQVRRVVEDCMNNIHPIYHVKTLMIKRELAKDPALANENWERFLPQFKKKNVQRKKPKDVKKKQEYTPFPPPQQPRKEDLQLESGEYFLSEQAKAASKRQAAAAKQAAKVAERQQQRAEAFVPPKKEPHGKKKELNESSGTASLADMAAGLASKLSGKKRASAGDVAAFLADGPTKKDGAKKRKKAS